MFPLSGHKNALGHTFVLWVDLLKKIVEWIGTLLKVIMSQKIISKVYQVERYAQNSTILVTAKISKQSKYTSRELQLQ